MPDAADFKVDSGQILSLSALGALTCPINSRQVTEDFFWYRNLDKVDEYCCNINRYNVMNPVDRKMNVKGISAFEAAENKTSASIIPGMERDKGMQRENFHRTSLRNSINVTK